MSLSDFFDVSSVAVIGASSDPLRIGGRPVAALIKYWLPNNPERRIYPINPNREKIQGIQAYSSVHAVGEKVDLAIIAVPARAVPSAIEDCARAGCRAAIVFTSGFGETGSDGQARQQELVVRARELGVRLLGPNCLGFLDMHQGLFPTFADAANYDGHLQGSVGVASQSGAVMSQLLMLARRRRLGLSKAISTGNEADLDLPEAIRFLAKDPATKLIIVYCETARDGGALIEAFEAARQSRKPILMIKSGRSEAGRAAALSHTGALAGADKIFDAVLTQYGVQRVDSLTDAIDIAYVAAQAKPPSGVGRVGIVTISGGAGVLMADQASAEGMALPPPSQEAQAALAELIPYASASNPLDTTAQAVNELGVWSKSVATLLDGTYDAIVMYLAYFGESDRLFEPLLKAMADLPGGGRPPIIFCSLFNGANAARAEDAGFLVFEDPSCAVRALAGWSRLGRRPDVGDDQPEPLAPARLSLPDMPEGQSEAALSQLLERASIKTPPQKLVTSPDAAAEAGRELGWPVVLKVSSPDLPHKTDAGGVRLNLKSEKEVRAAYAAILEAIADKRPDARIDGVLVAQQITGGIELILGSQQDPAFGTIVMVGAGGVLTELFEDVAFCRAPLREREARDMIARLKVSALLDGFRGGPAYSRDALVRAILDFSTLALRLAPAANIEINPLLVGERDCFALDVLLEPVD